MHARGRSCWHAPGLPDACHSRNLSVVAWNVSTIWKQLPSLPPPHIFGASAAMMVLMMSRRGKPV
eukprot:3367127-Prymnesium_polylepis.1